MGERMTTARERDRVILAQFDGAAGQARAIGGLLRGSSSNH